MIKSSHVSSLAIMAASLAMVGCATTRPVAYSGLATSSQLQPNRNDATGRIAYAYSTPVDWRQYSSVILEPVGIYRGNDNQFEKVSEEDKTVLAHYMHEQFHEKLRLRYNLGPDADPKSIRVKLTLTGAKTTPPVVGTFTHFDLAGGPYNAVQSIRGKEGMFMGSVSYAVEIYEASTDRLLSAYVAKQYPNAMNVKSTLGGLGAAKTGLQKGADDLLARLN